MFANDSNDGTDCDEPHNELAWLDSVAVHTLPLPHWFVNTLINARIITARQLLHDHDRLSGLAAPVLIAEALLFVRTLAELGEDTVRSMSARSWA